MNGFPWLTVAGGIPLLGALVHRARAVDARPTARRMTWRRATGWPSSWRWSFSLVTLVWVIVMATRFNASGPTYQLTEQYSWIPQFGVHYAVGVDGIALVLIGMTAVLQPVVVLASWNDVDNLGKPVKNYFALMMVLETMTIGVFAATDVFLFYVFFEAMLIPMYFMIGSFGVGPRQYAAVKFLLYSLLGGLLMLVAVIALYVYAGQSAATGHHGTFLIQSLLQVSLSPTVQKWLFLGFFIAFAIKAPLWPFHTWLPDAAAVRPARRGRADARRDGQGRHLRDDPLLPGAVPGGGALLHGARSSSSRSSACCTGRSWRSARRRSSGSSVTRRSPTSASSCSASSR